MKRIDMDMSLYNINMASESNTPIANPPAYCYHPLTNPTVCCEEYTDSTNCNFTAKILSFDGLENRIAQLSNTIGICDINNKKTHETATKKEVIDCLKSRKFATIGFSVILKLIKNYANETGITKTELRNLLSSIKFFPNSFIFKYVSPDSEYAFDGVFDDILYKGESKESSDRVLRDEKDIMDDLKPILAKINNPTCFGYMASEIAIGLFPSYSEKSKWTLSANLIKMGTALPKDTDKHELQCRIGENLTISIYNTLSDILYIASWMGSDGTMLFFKKSDREKIMKDLKPILAKVSNHLCFKFMAWNIATVLFPSSANRFSSDRGIAPAKLAEELMEMGTALPEGTAKDSIRSALEEKIRITEEDGLEKIRLTKNKLNIESDPARIQV